MVHAGFLITKCCEGENFGKGILYWITGLSGAGKTTIGNALYYKLRQNKSNIIILDGDILKIWLEIHWDTVGRIEKESILLF